MMERVTISMPDDFATELAEFMSDNHYENRSEAVRDLARLGLKQSRIDRGVAGPCIATLSYIYDHHTRELPKRLTDAHHAHHGLQVATMHVHLDADSCLEVAVLRGDACAIRDFSKTVIAERGVTYGQVSFAPMATPAETHDHAGGPPRRHHVHSA
jgi:CopG family nickel-responsive transcriptional regulator